MYLAIVTLAFNVVANLVCMPINNSTIVGPVLGGYHQIGREMMHGSLKRSTEVEVRPLTIFEIIKITT